MKGVLGIDYCHLVFRPIQRIRNPPVASHSTHATRRNPSLLTIPTRLELRTPPNGNDSSLCATDQLVRAAPFAAQPIRTSHLVTVSIGA